MFRVITAFSMLSSVGLCAAMPIVNVIADQPMTEPVQAGNLRGARSTQRSLLEEVDTAQKNFEVSAQMELDVQSKQLDNLRQMSARIGGLA